MVQNSRALATGGRQFELQQVTQGQRRRETTTELCTSPLTTRLDL